MSIDIATARRWMRRASGLVVFLAATLTVRAPAAAEVRVVATIKPVHSLVAGVMEGRGSPRLLIDGSGSPHTYTLKPSDAKALNEARLIVRVSEGLEVFLDRVTRSLPKSARLVTLDKLPGMTLLPLRQGGAFEAHDHASHSGKGAGHSHGRKSQGGAASNDSHIWLDPKNAEVIVAGVAKVLSELDPEGAPIYLANATRMQGELSALIAELEAVAKTVRGRPFIVFHDAYQYFERRFGVAAAGSITVSPEVPPSAKRLVALRKRIGTLGPACVFAEPQFEPRVITTVIEGTTVRSGVLDPLGAALPAGPALYGELLRTLARSLVTCLVRE